MRNIGAISAKLAKAFAILAGVALFAVVVVHAFQTILTWSTRSDLLLSVFLVVALAFYGIARLISHFGKRVFHFVWSVLRSILAALRHNPDIRRIAQRHPRLSAWLRHRLALRTFSGLPASLLALAFAYVVTSLAGVIWSVRHAGVITDADYRIAELLALFRAPRAVSTLVWITSLGDWLFILIASACLVAVLWRRKRRAFILPFIVGLGGAAVSAEILKLFMHRRRPAFGAVVEGAFSSFPSGHSTLSLLFYGFLAYIAWKSFASWRKRFDAFFAAVAVVAVIGFSRLYLGVHFLSDVWAGYLLGSLWLLVAIGLCERSTFGVPMPAYVVGKRERTLQALAVFAVACAGLFLATVLVKPAAVPQEPAAATHAVADAGLLLFEDRSLSRFTETVIAAPQEPISMIVLAKDDQSLIDAFQAAGWSLADQITPSTVTNLMSAAIVNGAYVTAPMTPSFWEGNIHDFGFEKPAGNGGIRKRHHARFWKTDYRTLDGRDVYVGTASLDIGIKWFVTHRIAPDIDTERSYLVQDLKTAGRVESIREEEFIPRSLGKNFARDLFFTDGKIEIMRLGTQ